MAEPFDLQQTLDPSFQLGFFVQHKETLFRVTLADGVFDFPGKRLLFNVIFWQPLLRRNMAIFHARHAFRSGLFSKAERVRVNTEIYADILQSYPQDATAVWHEFMRGEQQLFRVCTFELGAYHRSVDMAQIAETLIRPEVAAITQFEPDASSGIKKIEQLYETGAARVMSTMSSDALRDTVFYPFLRLDALNATQFPKVIMAVGPCTDVDDAMFNRAILGSYARGLRDIVEYAIDSRAAAKSEWYNASTMGKAQYSSRKQQLLAMSVRYIYRGEEGDCNSPVLVPFFIARQYAAMTIGKFIVENGRLIELTRENIRQFFDRVVNLRSPLTCRYQDGFCRICGGRLVDFMPHGVVPGIAATHEVMAHTAQLVLSNKHAMKTRAAIYVLPKPFHEVFITTGGNEIYLRPDVDLNTLAIGVPFKSVERLGDLKHVASTTIIKEQYFSDLTQMMLGDARTLAPLTPMIRMIDDNKNYPHLSGNFLRMLREHPENIQTAGDIVWLRFQNFNRDDPVMGSVVVNDSTRAFVQRVEYLFTKKIQAHTSLEEVLSEFSRVIWSGGVKPHLMHLEVCLKANLITDDVDYDIPVVTDPKHVRFAPLAQIIPRRYLAPQFAYEQWNKYVTAPGTFIFPKGTSLFDPLLSFADDAPLFSP